jgi:WD40 repeat protein
MGTKRLDTVSAVVRRWVVAMVVLGLLVAGAAAADKPSPRLDRQGDPLPAGALTRLGTLRFRHGTFIDALAFSPDGKLVATFARDERVRVWDAATGKQVRALEMPWASGCGPLLLAPDGKTLACCSGGFVRAWEVATGKKVLATTTPLGTMNRLAFSAEGKVLAMIDGKHVEEWGVATGKRLRQHDNPTKWAGGLGYAGDGRLILIDGQPPYTVYAVADGQSLGRCEGRRGGGNLHFVFSPDGKTVASTGDNQDPAIRLWDPTSGRERRALEGHTKGVYDLAFSGDGKLLASVSRDGTVRVWDTATGKESHRHAEPGGNQVGVALSPDGKSLWVRGADYGVRLLDTATGKDVLPPGHNYPARYIAFAPDGKTVWSAAEGPIFGWDIATGKRLHTLRYHLAPGAWFAPDGRTVRFIGDGQSIHEIDLLKDREVRTWQWKGDGYFAPGFSPDGTRLKACKQIEDRGRGQYLLSVWELTTDQEPRPLGSLEFGGFQSTFAPDGHLLINQGDHARFWDPTTGSELAPPTFQGKGDMSSVYTFAPDGRLVLEDSRKEMVLWEALTGRPVGRLEGVHRPRPSNRPTDGSLVTAFSADGRLLATGGTEGEVQLWDVAALKLIATLAGHACDLEALAFAPDGKRLVSSSQDTTLLVWDLTPFADRPPFSRELTASEMRRLWADLAGDSAATAHGAAWRLVSGRDKTVAFLRGRLRPAGVETGRRIDRLIADLDDDSFEVREAASKELVRQGKVAEPALKRLLNGRPSAEVRRRAEGLLARLKEWSLSPEDRQALRALAALERIGSGDARRLIEQLAEGQPDALLTREARAARRRLDRPLLRRLGVGG